MSMLYQKLNEIFENDTYLFFKYVDEVYDILMEYINNHLIFYLKDGLIVPPMFYTAFKIKRVEDRNLMWFETPYYKFVDGKKRYETNTIDVNKLYFFEDYNDNIRNKIKQKLLQKEIYNIVSMSLIEIEIVDNEEKNKTLPVFVDKSKKQNIYAEFLTLTDDNGNSSFLIKMISNPNCEDVELYDTFKYNRDVYVVYGDDFDEMVKKYVKEIKMMGINLSSHIKTNKHIQYAYNKFPEIFV